MCMGGLGFPINMLYPIGFPWDVSGIFTYIFMVDFFYGFHVRKYTGNIPWESYGI